MIFHCNVIVDIRCKHLCHVHLLSQPLFTQNHTRKSNNMRTHTHTHAPKAVLILFSHKEYFRQGTLTDYLANLALSASYSAPNPYL